MMRSWFFRLSAVAASLLLGVSCPAEEKAPMQSNVTVQIVGNDKLVPETEQIVLTGKGVLRDTLSHAYTDEALKAHLRSKNIIKDKVAYLNVVVSSDDTDLVTLEILQQVATRMAKLADPDTKTVITITFKRIIIKPRP
jgi:hypothetical protein